MKLSVVMPTRDRAPALGETLAALARQRAADLAWEVVVVDNGSADGTPSQLAAAARDFPVALHAVREPRPGPAVARNTGVRRAAGEIVLFLGDDMAPARDDLVAGHAACHAARAVHDDRYGVLGHVTWRPDRPVTPFMRWLEHGGPQFRFFELAPGPVRPSVYLVTPNLSLRRSALERVGGFDEHFPWAAHEDTELAVRLERDGLVLDYHPELRVLHDHPTSLEHSLHRMGNVGRSARLMAHLHPGLDHPGAPRPAGPLWRFARGADPLWRLLSRGRVPARLRERAWTARHMTAYADGWAAGIPEGPGP